jgi:hypothetical protein
MLLPVPVFSGRDGAFTFVACGLLLLSASWFGLSNCLSPTSFWADYKTTAYFEFELKVL